MSHACRFPVFASFGRGALPTACALLLFVSHVNAQESTVPAAELALGQSVAADPVTAAPAPSSSIPPSQAAAVALERPSQSALYAQFFGPAGMFGVGFSHRPFASLAFDAGAGGFAINVERSTFSGAAISLGVSGLFGRRNHSFELGAGGAVLFTHEMGESDVVPLIGPHLGYRYQPIDGGWFVRATVHGVVSLRNGSVTPWPGVSLGGTWDS